MNGSMALRSQEGLPERDHPFFIPGGNRSFNSIPGQDSYTLRGSGVSWPGTGDGRLGPGRGWVSAAALGTRKRAGHEYGDPSGRDPRITEGPIGPY